MSPASEHCAPPPRLKRRGGLVIPHPPRWHQRAGAWAVVALVRTMASTLRFRFRDRSGLPDGAVGPAICCVWHNRLPLCMEMYRYYHLRHRQAAGLAALVSASKDGAFLASTLECFGVRAVRGSSSRRGPQALLELTTWAERGYDLAITPDGPRGPCYVVQEGVMSLAQLTGLPILPASYHLSRKLRLNTWDRFQIPLPFARCEVSIAPTVRVPRDASDAQREELRRHLEQTLKAITRD